MADIPAGLELHATYGCVPVNADSVDGYRLLATHQVDAVIREGDLTQAFAGAMGTPAKPRTVSGLTTKAVSSRRKLKRSTRVGLDRQQVGGRSSSCCGGSSGVGSSACADPSRASTSTSSSSGGSGGGDSQSSSGDSDGQSSSRGDGSASSVAPATNTDDSTCNVGDISAKNQMSTRPYKLSQSAKRRLRRLRLKTFRRIEQQARAVGGVGESMGAHASTMLSSQSNGSENDRAGHAHIMDSDGKVVLHGAETIQAGRKRRRRSAATRTFTVPVLAGNDIDQQQFSSLAAMAAARRQALEQEHIEAAVAR